MNCNKKVMVLKGRLITPIVSKKTFLRINGCKASINNPKRRYYTRINTTKPMYPYSFICYLGTLEVSFEDH
jgi:hypothetical protein